MRQLVLLAWIGCVVMGEARTARADEYEDHVSKAMALSRAEQHRDALREWEAAYAVRQAPRLLYEIARSQQSLGLGTEAQASYQRFLTADRGEDAAARADAEAQLRRLRPLDPPRPVAAPQPSLPPMDGDIRYIPVRYERRPNKGLMTAGIVLLSIGYGGAFVTGVTMTSLIGGTSSSSDRYLQNASGLLIIPIVGPLISSIYYPSVYRSDAAAYWSLPWMMTSAPLQVAGLVMTVVGALDVRNRPVMPSFSQRVHIAPYATLGGGGLVAVGRS
jgi:hypothetical protein